MKSLTCVGFVLISLVVCPPPSGFAQPAQSKPSMTGTQNNTVAPTPNQIDMKVACQAVCGKGTSENLEKKDQELFFQCFVGNYCGVRTGPPVAVTHPSPNLSPFDLLRGVLPKDWVNG